VDTTDPIQHLSDRERDILALIAKGRTNAEIGDALGLRFDTVKWYVSEILGKLGVDSREQAAEAWRAWKRPRAAVGRRLRGLVGLPFTQVAAGAGAAAAAGTLIIVGAASLSGAQEPAPEHKATATPTTIANAWTPDVPVGDPVPLFRVEHNGASLDVGFYRVHQGVCLYHMDSTMPAAWRQFPPQRCDRFSPRDYEEAGTPRVTYQSTGEITFVTGWIDEGVATLRVELADGTVIEPELHDGQAFDFLPPIRFWGVALDGICAVNRVHTLDRDGAVIASRPVDWWARDTSGDRPSSTPVPLCGS
jgi:DNA-binding CsgD family transcriptional regulator